MKFHTKKEHEERVKESKKEIERKRGREIYGARDAAVDRAHSKMVNSNGY